MDAIKIFFELLRPIPMPWQVAVFVFIGAVIVFFTIRLSKVLVALFGKMGMKLTEWLIKFLLLPEHLATSFFHWIKLGDLPGAVTYDDLVLSVGEVIYKFFQKISTFQEKNLKFPVGWILLSVILIIVIWYMREVPDYQNTTFSEYVDWGFGLYYNLQSKVLK